MVGTTVGGISPAKSAKGSINDFLIYRRTPLRKPPQVLGVQKRREEEKLHKQKVEKRVFEKSVCSETRRRQISHLASNLALRIKNRRIDCKKRKQANGILTENGGRLGFGVRFRIPTFPFVLHRVLDITAVSVYLKRGKSDVVPGRRFCGLLLQEAFPSRSNGCLFCFDFF